MSPDTNGRVSLRELIEQRFDALDARLDKVLPDHETRIRSLEKRITWSNVAQGTGTLFATVLAALGLKQ